MSLANAFAQIGADAKKFEESLKAASAAIDRSMKQAMSGYLTGSAGFTGEARAAFEALSPEEQERVARAAIRVRLATIPSAPEPPFQLLKPRLTVGMGNPPTVNCKCIVTTIE